MKLFDKHALVLHQQRARETFHAHRFLYDHVSHEITARLKDIKQNFSKVLNLSPYPVLYPALEQPYYEGITVFPEGPYDLIFSCLHMHWINQLPGFLKDVHTALAPGGLFLGSLWGGDTLTELRASLLQAELDLTGGVSPRVAPFMHPSDAPLLLGKSGFANPVVDTETLTVTYPSLTHLMKDLRGMGEANILTDRPKTFTRRTLFKNAEKIYGKLYGYPLPATFEVIYLTGWK